MTVVLSMLSLLLSQLYHWAWKINLTIVRYSLHSVLIDIFPYGTMTKGTTSVLITLINATDFVVGPLMF